MGDLLKSHALSALSLGAGLLLIFGAIIVIEQAPARPSSQAGIWSTEGNASANPVYNGTPLSPQALPALGTSNSPIFLPITPKPPLGEEGTAQTDLASLLASLIHPSESTAPDGTQTNTLSAYDYIPQGLLATTSPVTNRSNDQQALYEYGNEVGSLVQTYESTNRGAPTVLKDQVEDRQSSAKGQAVKDLGASLSKIGTDMKKMSPVPDSLGALHTNLAESYVLAGEKLAAIPDAKSDQQFLSAIQNYNASADALTQNFVTLSTFFSISGVRFSSGDPGSIFSFSPGGSL